MAAFIHLPIQYFEILICAWRFIQLSGYGMNSITLREGAPQLRCLGDCPSGDCLPVVAYVRVGEIVASVGSGSLYNLLFCNGTTGAWI